MPFADLIAKLEALEVECAAAASAAFAPLDAALSSVRRVMGDAADLPADLREVHRTLERVAGGEEPTYREHFQESLRLASLKRLVSEACTRFGQPGVPLKLTVSEVIDAVCPDEGHGWSRHRTIAPLARFAEYLTATYGGHAGARLAEQQTREDIRRHLVRESPVRTARAVQFTAYAYSEPCFNDASRFQYAYGHGENLRHLAIAFTKALSLLGLPPSEHALTTDVTGLLRRPLESRTRLAVGAGISVVCYRKKLVFEFPVGLGIELMAWLDAPPLLASVA